MLYRHAIFYIYKLRDNPRRILEMRVLAGNYCFGYKPGSDDGVPTFQAITLKTNLLGKYDKL